MASKRKFKIEIPSVFKFLPDSANLNYRDMAVIYRIKNLKNVNGYVKHGIIPAPFYLKSERRSSAQKN